MESRHQSRKELGGARVTPSLAAYFTRHYMKGDTVLHHGTPYTLDDLKRIGREIQLENQEQENPGRERHEQTTLGGRTEGL